MALVLILLGALLTLAAAYGAGCTLTRRLELPATLRFAFGSAALSLVIFAVLALRAGKPAILIPIALLAAAGTRIRLARPSLPLWLAVPFFGFGVFYLVNALAPEIQTDPNTYHFAPAIEALRHGGFERDVSFYAQLPHATELLYVIAYSVGGAPSAKLVHFAFLLASMAVIVALGQRFELPGYANWSAAFLVFAAPVTGVAGTAAFNDATLMFAILSTVHALLLAPPWFAGTLAGFCHAVKMTGGIAIPAGLIFYAAKRRWRDFFLFGTVAGMVMTPWLVKNLLQTGNPLAPFFNAWFPNPFFTPGFEAQLSTNLRSYGISFWQRFPELLWGYRVQGMIGPAWILAPLVLLGLRRRNQQLLLALGCFFAIPWLLNAGARFLIPALPFLALALMNVLPKPVIIGVVLVHAITAVTVHPLYSWRLEHFPLGAALHLESHDAYLRRTNFEYRVAKVVEQHTKPGDLILDLHGMHAAHLDRRLIAWWQSHRGRQAFRTLMFGFNPGRETLDLVTASFPMRTVRAVRLRQVGAAGNPWAITEVELRSGDFRVAHRRAWTLDAFSNAWDLPLAFDRQPASFWIADEDARPGQWITVDFQGTLPLSEIRITGSHRPNHTRMEVDIQAEDGAWINIPVQARPLPLTDLRKEAVAYLRSQGFTHVVAHAGTTGTGPLGYVFANQSEEWGLEYLDGIEPVHVFRIPPKPGSAAP